MWWKSKPQQNDAIKYADALRGGGTDDPQGGIHSAEDGGPHCGPQIERAMTANLRGSSQIVSPENGRLPSQGAVQKNPPCGAPTADNGEAQSRATTTQCGEDADRLQRANAALEGLAQGWKRKAWRSASAKELAIEFVRSLQTRPELIGQRLRSAWIEAHYLPFCLSLHVARPPYKDFAKELALLMSKKRHEVWRDGTRITYTTYLIPDPAPAVVDLSKEKLRQA
jgi:hypothetical protein